MTYVDGNAIAGQLALAFGRDLSTADGVCESCGMRHPLAAAHVYLRCPGTVVRCPACEHVELVLVEIRHRIQVTLLGLAAIHMPPVA